MKITFYELLGMIKDGKMPKKIKYDDDIWKYVEEKENYINSNNASLNWDYVALYCLKESVEILEEENELHANSVEFNVNNDKKDCIITLDENDLGIDKLHLDNCYFYKENDKWYVKKYDFKTIELEEKKIPKKLPNNFHYTGEEENIANKINEVIDYLHYLKSKGDE